MTTTTTRSDTCPSWCAGDDVNIEGNGTSTGLPIRDHVSAEGQLGGQGAGYIVRTDVINPDGTETPRDPRIFLDSAGSERGYSPAEARQVAADLLRLADEAEEVSR